MKTLHPSRGWKMSLRALAAFVLATVAAQPIHAETATRSSAFEYSGTTGILNVEIVEPDNGEFCLRTAYTHDAYGNRSQASTSNCGPSVPTHAAFATRSVTTSYVTSGATTSVVINGVAYSVPSGAFPTTTTNALGHTETKKHDPRFGQAVSAIGPNGLETRWEHDAFGRKTRELRADGTYTTFAYCFFGGSPATTGDSDQCASLAVVQPPHAVRYVHSASYGTDNLPTGPWGRVFYDSLDREIRSETQAYDGNGQGNRIIAKVTTYNAYGAAVSVTQPFFTDTGRSTVDGTQAAGATTTVYDTLGRPTITQSPYTSSNGTIQTAVTQFSYNGLSVTTTNAKGQQRTEQKNPIGQVARVIDASGAQLAHRYDAFGNLVETLDALGNRTLNQYDIRGRKFRMIDPDAGTWNYTYDALGQLRKQQNPKQAALGQETVLGYDLLGRLTQRVEPEYVTNWHYDVTSAGAACGKSVGKLCEAKTSHGVTRGTTYDVYGRPSASFMRVAGGPTFSSTTHYDPVKGRADWQTSPTGYKVAFSYTAAGFLEKVTNGTTGALLWHAQKVNAWGKAEVQRYGNGIDQRAVYDGLTGNVLELNAGFTGTAYPTAVMRQRTAWDAIGNLVSRADDNGAGNGNATTETFTYDAINRLASYQVSNPGIPDGMRTVTLQYNAIGNLLFKSDVGVYRYNASGGGSVRPHAVASVNGVNYAYDANGNLVSADAGKYRAIAYTSFNLPDASQGLLGTNGTRYTWQYGPDHERVKEMRNGRVTWYFHPDNQGGLAFEHEVAEGGAKTNRHFISAGGQTIAVLISNGDYDPVVNNAAAFITKTEYWHKDHLGSLVATTNEAGGVTQRYAYDPFGKRRSTDGNYDMFGNIVLDYPAASDRGFTGHEHLDDVGVIHMNGRIYDPHIGRFMQADPVVQYLDNLQAYNRYSYVLNNPLNATDPSGHIPFIVTWLATQVVAQTMHHVVAAIIVHTAYASAGGASGQDAWRAGFGAGFSVLANTLVGHELGTHADGPNPSPTWDEAVFWKKALAHGVVGCVSAKISGTSCGDAFRGAAAGSALAGLGDGASDDPVIKLIIRMVIGGTAAVAGGGKFENGAAAAAFGYLYNDQNASSDCHGEANVCARGAKNAEIRQSVATANEWLATTGSAIEVAWTEYVFGAIAGTVVKAAGAIKAGVLAVKSAGSAAANRTVSKIEDITKPGSKLPNIKTDVSKSEFEKNLLDNGFSKSTSKDGRVNIFTNGNKKYTTRDFAKSTDGPTAEVFKNNQPTSKIRLGDE